MPEVFPNIKALEGCNQTGKTLAYENAVINVCICMFSKSKEVPCGAHMLEAKYGWYDRKDYRIEIYI